MRLYNLNDFNIFFKIIKELLKIGEIEDKNESTNKILKFKFPDNFLLYSRNYDDAIITEDDITIPISIKCDQKVMIKLTYTPPPGTIFDDIYFYEINCAIKDLYENIFKYNSIDLYCFNTFMNEYKNNMLLMNLSTLKNFPLIGITITELIEMIIFKSIQMFKLNDIYYLLEANRDCLAQIITKNENFEKESIGEQQYYFNGEYLMRLKYN